MYNRYYEDIPDFFKYERLFLSLSYDQLKRVFDAYYSGKDLGLTLDDYAIPLALDAAAEGANYHDLMRLPYHWKPKEFDPMELIMYRNNYTGNGEEVILSRDKWNKIING